MTPIDSHITVIIPCSVADYPYFLSWFKEYIASVSSSVRHIIVINGLKLPLPHKRFQHENLSYILVDKECTPGEARNIAFDHVSDGFIAFLDAKTIPSENWLNHILEISHSNSPISKIGTVSYSSTRFWHYPLLCATYGFRHISSLPGSIIHYSALHINGYFLPRLRAGEDIDWLWRARQRNIFAPGATPVLIYSLDYKLNLFNYLRKWYRNYSHSSRLPYVSRQQRYYYIIFAFLFLVFLSYVWNGLIAGWNTDSALYIPYVTRLTASTSSLIYIVLRCIYLPIRKGAKPFLTLLLLPIILSISLIFDVVKLIAFFPALIGYASIND